MICVGNRLRDELMTGGEKQAESRQMAAVRDVLSVSPFPVAWAESAGRFGTGGGGQGGGMDRRKEEGSP